ncbi:amino acid adenylation domain-containing protein, partial [Fulvivirga kasyanovii]|uniref:amino acid adenylation domain-containing protein n=1 Tax=Fulvivirga kasyanovii TaxID=396812 RepID=UPI0031D72B1B
LLGAVTTDPGQALYALDYLSAAEKQELLKDFNTTASEYPSATVPELFSARAAAHPNSVAVVYQDRELTYGELEARSNQLAHYLQATYDIGRDDLVGLMVDRSEWLMVGILGILKAGGAYVPLDPAYPRQRIDYMIKDAGLGLVLANTSVDDVSGKYLLFEDILNESRSYPDAPVEYSGHNSDLAYVMYTSGSTGKPKGVMVEHRSIVRLIKNTNYITVTANDRILQTGSLSFDASTFEMWGTLLNGGRLYLMNHEQLMDPLDLKSAIRAYGITIMWFTASWFNQLVEADIDIFEPLSYLLVGGDKLSPKHVHKVRQKFEHLTLINGYGPTENTTFSICHRIEARDGDLIPLGRPISNSSVFILDEHGKLLPVGVEGELYLGGDGLARGYLNQEELTREKFIANPYGEGRLYKTGDLGCWRSDGLVDFAGRKDVQVKIRGYRVEPGEIENALQNISEVKEAVVTIHEGEHGSKMLIGYIVGELHDEKHYSHQLKQVLPSYMVPSQFIFLDALPLTSNGKVDKRALPMPDTEVLSGENGFVAARNEVEQKLVEIWSSVLGRSNVGIEDNFFLCGGDSIKALQIVSLMYGAGYRLQIKDIFQYPEIATLALNAKPVTTEASQEAVTGQIPLTPIQQHFFAGDDKGQHHFNQSVMLSSKDRLKLDDVYLVFNKIQEHHDALRMTYSSTGDQVVQVNGGLSHEVSVVEYHYEDGPDALSQMELAIAELQSNISLEEGPLMKVALFHLHDGDRLMIVIHHLVIDGVSWRILLEDINILFRQLKAGDKFKLPLKTDSFKNWSENLLDFANSSDLLKELPYWKAIDSKGVAMLPVDFEEGSNLVKDEARHTFYLSADLTEALLGKVNKAFNTEINDILLAAFAQAVERSFGLDKLLIALEGHGREGISEELDVSRTVGWFTSIYPVVLDITGKAEVRQRIKGIKESLRQIPNKGIGYGVLKYLTRPELIDNTELSYEPKISFNYLGQFDSDFKDHWFQLAQEEPDGNIARDRRRDYEIDIMGIVSSGKLHVSVNYSKSRFKADTMARLSDAYQGALQELITYCLQQEDQELTPSDLTHSELTIEDLETFFD